VVAQVVAADGTVVEETEPKILRRRVVSERSSLLAREILAQVTEIGTGKAARLPQFRVAGKTGTAQKVDPVAKGYHPTARVASFIGSVPAMDPEISILVVIDEPQGPMWQRYGGVVAAPAFREIAARTLPYLGVLPETSGLVAEAETTNKPRTVAPERVASAEPVQPRVSYGPTEMPDLIGMSMRAVLRVSEDRGFQVLVEGTGKAVRQEPQPGAPLPVQRTARVVFAPST
jgi:cell division protein FtsI (penicillin-binding protein 3)